MIQIGTDIFPIVDPMGRQLLERPCIQWVLECFEGEQVVFRWCAKTIGPQWFDALTASAQNDDVQALLLQGQINFHVYLPGGAREVLRKRHAENPVPRYRHGCLQRWVGLRIRCG